MTKEEAIVLAAKAMCPYGWDDGFWQTESRVDRYPRNQLHVKKVAIEQATLALKVFEEWKSKQ